MLESVTRAFEYVFKRLYEISGIEQFSLKSLALFFLVALVGLTVEYIFIADKKQSSFHRLSKLNKSILNDLISWLIDAFGLFRFLGVVLTLGIFYAISWVLTKDVNVFAVNYIPVTWLQFLVLFLLSDLKNYWKHRLFHSLQSLWKLHSFHHSATEFVSLSSHRGHLAEGAIAIIIEAVFWKLAGVSPVHIIYLAYLTELQQLFQHSNLTQNWGWVGKYILVSPAAHKIHHSTQEKHFNKNFGTVFIFWDRLFGTYYQPKNERFALGIPDNYFNKHHYLYDVFESYKLFWIQLGKEVSGIFKKK
jgi:sterol desaturase/sphingolipid hydroxylase (fatty acid hydroxylase superfamily)